MAVLPRLPGLTVDIVVNGAPQVEYEPSQDDVTNDDSYTTTRYIEAEAGSNFEVNFRVAPAFKSGFDFQKYDLCCEVWIDGLHSRSRVFSKEALKKVSLDGRTEVIDGVVVGSGTDWKMRKFTFSELVAGQ
jgi:hypothetical protein